MAEQQLLLNNLQKTWRSVVRNWWSPSMSDDALDIEPARVGLHAVVSDWRKLDASPRLTWIKWRYSLSVIPGLGQRSIAFRSLYPGVLMQTVGVRSAPPSLVELAVSLTNTEGWIDIPVTTILPDLSGTWPTSPSPEQLTVEVLSAQTEDPIVPLEYQGNSSWSAAGQRIWGIDDLSEGQFLGTHVTWTPPISGGLTLFYEIAAVLPRSDWQLDAVLNPYI